MPEEFSAKEENGQQPQQQASTGADCSVQAPHFESERDDDQTKAEETQGPQDEASEGGCPPSKIGQPQFLQDCWILEVFAGTAGMVSAATAEGLRRSIEVDHVRLASRRGKVIQLDLLLASRRQLLWK